MKNVFKFKCGKSKKKQKKLKYRAVGMVHMPWIHSHFYLIGENLMFSLPDDKKAPLIMNYRTKKGNPALVDPNTPRIWESSHPDVISVAVDPVDNKWKAFPGLMPAEGSPIVQLKETADADLGSGFKPVTGIIEAVLVPGEAFSGEGSFGPLEDA